MNNIDILEEIKNKFNKTMKILALGEHSTFVDNSFFDDFGKLINISETLIAENKELKEEKEELKRENREIRNWKYTIDTYEDLDLLKRLDIIKIKGKEYIDKNLYDELKKDKKALINNYSKVLGEFISKDKIKAKIEPKLKELDKNMKKEWQEYGNSREYQDMEDEWNFLQSLLGKE